MIVVGRAEDGRARTGSSASADANRPGERHNFDMPRPCLAEGGGRRIRGRSRGVDVVDQHDCGRNAPLGMKGRGDVAPAIEPGQAPLPGRAADTHERRLERELPCRRERPCELLGRVVTTAQAAIDIGRDERNAFGIRAIDRFGDDRSSPCGEPPQPALLPGRHDGTNARVVLDRGTRTRERDPAAGTLAAPLHRPCSRRATAVAPRRCQPRQR